MVEDTMPELDDAEVGLSLDGSDLEAEFCRLPDVTAVRVVTDTIGRPIEVHVIADPGKPAKQVVRDIQSVAMATFGIEIDRRIVSVVQLGTDLASATHGGFADSTRVTILGVTSTTSGTRCEVKVTLTTGGNEFVGYAEGLTNAAARPRSLALATLDALRQMEPAAEAFDLETVQVVPVGSHSLVVTLLSSVQPPSEHHLVGSAIVRSTVDDATVRAVLNATNRRLPHLARDAHGH
jgi:hypothetical protein